MFFTILINKFTFFNRIFTYFWYGTTDMSSIIIFEWEIDKITDFQLKMIIYRNELFHNYRIKKLAFFTNNYWLRWFFLIFLPKNSRHKKRLLLFREKIQDFNSRPQTLGFDQANFRSFVGWILSINLIWLKLLELAVQFYKFWVHSYLYKKFKLPQTFFRWAQLVYAPGCIQ